MRARGRSTVEPVDYRSAVSVLPELVTCWRDLQFDHDGVVVVPSSHQRREGLRVLEGVHPHPGTRYRLMIVESVAKASGRMETKTVSLVAEVLANDAEALCVRFVAAHQSQVNIDITLDHPGALRAVSLVIDGRLDGSWLTRGAVTASSRLSLDRLPPKRSSSPQLQAEFRHRRALGSATVRVRPRHGDTWEVAVGIHARGAGLLRPIAAIASPWLAGAVRRQLRDHMAGFPDRVDRFNRDWRPRVSEAGHRDIARQWLDDFLNALPASAPRGGD